MHSRFPGELNEHLSPSDYVRRIQFGSQKGLFTGNARQLDPFTVLVPVSSSGSGTPVPGRC